VAKTDSNEIALWDREYADLKVIPSSERRTPSKALLLFAELLDYGHFKRVLDSGCGNGRNAVYLARKGCEVQAVDFSSVAVSKARHEVESQGLVDRVQLYYRSVLDTLPFPAEYFDLVLDSYVFCHFLGNDRENYRRNMQLLTKPDGYFMLSVFPPEDGYYGPMPRIHAGESIVKDPNNGLSKRLYTEREIEEYFSPDFQVVYSTSFRFNDTVRKETYLRRVLTIVFRRR